ncbi:acetoacetate--CoA ligase [Loktanella sp. IMCC34160]|uniref:acetoacetate--CoA ligase n=1 Tax=Loktanella sp. IMCC34160 TaxID=2510646 RepID=UPI00101D9781|nr:acetoacetate--CoA ligase [Loktanella sp. IMCC34160]RYG90292.1 acetoacetate--CoA ligase [Loktanella sp. IMCC34160]
MTTSVLWTPDDDRRAATELSRFREPFARKTGATIDGSDDLAAVALEDLSGFWDAIWDHMGVIGDKGDGPVIVGDDMISTRFFPGARLNVAENLLRLGGQRDPEADALVFRGEDKAQLRWSWSELETHVARLQKALSAAGVGAGDRVAGLLPNRPEAVAAMLAAVSLGAVWCSASPDFGTRAVLDRFGQIEPKVLFATDGYWYSGKAFDITDKLAEIASQLPSVTRTVVIDYLGTAQATAAAVDNGVTFAAFEADAPDGPLTFARMPFDHPLYILFSSGTTGAPKCIVHRAGGVLLQHLKEHALHADVRPGDRLFYFTTLGWMMWNWLVSGLARGATLLLFDGSPFHPRPKVLFDFASDERMTHFGTSAKYIDSLRKVEFKPGEAHDLSPLRAMMSTGSPLLGDSFDYVYKTLKPDLHLASISGGTDIVSCFVLGDPTAPVHRGEIQRAGFGMAVDVWRDDGSRAADGEKGELVCTRPFPSMPLGFWGDDGGARYRSAYFDRFDGVWCQGDFAERRATGGFVIHGRSDATLNPGGVRIGTAEIYAEVEKFPEVKEAVVIGQDIGDDVRVVLFVTMMDGAELTEPLIKEIKTAIRKGSSPRHVPALILAVADIPRTKSGKITELAVRDVVHGRAVKNTGSLANPEALDLFRDLPELKMDD